MKISQMIPCLWKMLPLFAHVLDGLLSSIPNSKDYFGLEDTVGRDLLLCNSVPRDGWCNWSSPSHSVNNSCLSNWKKILMLLSIHFCREWSPSQVAVGRSPWEETTSITETPSNSISKPRSRTLTIHQKYPPNVPLWTSLSQNKVLRSNSLLTLSTKKEPNLNKKDNNLSRTKMTIWCNSQD